MLRAAPGFDIDSNASGVVGIVVAHDDEPVHYRLTLREGRLTVVEEPATDADAGLHGSHEQWIAALGPDADHGVLDIVGDRQLAETVLKALSLLDD